MAWRTVQSKTGPRRYYYATERVRGAVRTFYFGFGPDAEEAAQKQKLRHEIRRARQRAIAEIVALRKLGADTFHEIDLLLRAALVATGFYKHARGEWRKRRYTMPTDHPFQGSPPPVPTTLKELVEQANSGDQSALDGLRKYLHKDPQAWKRVGDVAAHALESRVQQIANGNSLVAESIRMQIESLRTGLTGPQPSMIEQLAVTEVIVAWLEVNQVRLVAQFERYQPLGSHVTPLEKVATRRYSVALKTFRLVQAKRPEIERASKELTPMLGTPDGGTPQEAVQPTPTMHDE